MVTDVAAAGATVVTTSRELGAAEKIAEEEQEKGHDVRAQQLDLGNHESILGFCETIMNNYDDLHGLVNNAVARPMEHLYADIEDWKESMECNATGTLEITRRVAKHLAETGAGSVINIGSIYGMVGPTPHLYEGTDMLPEYEYGPAPDYYYHKSGLINMSKYFASLFGEEGVRVNCVSPGGIYSEDLDERFIEKYNQQTALDRMATAEDLSGVIVFLLSDAGKYITGANIPVDGGFTAK
jgi:NAD(P)-dependent dehydrogenase (short-subunit alcohol dehydrogenase family)